MASLGIPLIGLICLVIGLWDRSRRRRQPAPGYPYPPGPLAPPMGYPGPYPGPPHPGYPPQFYPQQRTGRSATVLIIIGAVLLTFGILGNLARVAATMGRDTHGAGRSQLPAAAKGPQIGQCFSQFDLGTEFGNATPIDCADPVGTYELAAKGGPTATCPDNERESSIYHVYTNESSTLCFAANLKEGQCYLKMDDGKATKLTPVDCDDRRFAQVKVDRRIDGSTDKSQCPPGTKAISYPTPARVYCIEKASP
jgi:hypothetical protein